MQNKITLFALWKQLLKSLEEEYSPVVNSNLLYGPVTHDDAGILCPKGKSVGIEVLGGSEKKKKRGEKCQFSVTVTAKTKKLDSVYIQATSSSTKLMQCNTYCLWLQPNHVSFQLLIVSQCDSGSYSLHVANGGINNKKQQQQEQQQQRRQQHFNMHWSGYTSSNIRIYEAQKNNLSIPNEQHSLAMY